MGVRKWAPKVMLAGLWCLGVLLGLACGGGTPERAAPVSQQPAPAAQPAAAQPAGAPQPAAAAQLAALQPAAPALRAQPPKETPKYGGTLYLAQQFDPPAGYDPMRVSGITLFAVAGTLNGSGNLVRSCPANVYDVCPGMAERWESNKDFTQWTFKLRDDVKWHDGTPFTAEDAKFWLELAVFGAKAGDKTRTPAIFKGVFGALEKVEVLEGNRLRLIFARPEVHALRKMAEPRTQIAHPRHLMKPLIERGQTEVSPQDVGWVSLGPFKMDKAEKGVRVGVRRSDLYWEKDEAGRRLPYLDEVVFTVVRDPSAQDAAIRVGRLDGGARFPGFTLTQERKAAYEKDLGARVWFAEVLTWRASYAMNTVKPGPLQDVRVRKAIGLWMDKEGAVATESGFGYKYTILAPANPFVSPDFSTWPGWNRATRERDRAEAKRLLAQSGYPTGGFEVEMVCRQGQVDRCEYVAGQLHGLGIGIKTKVLDIASWSQARIRGEIESTDNSAGGTDAFIPEELEGSMVQGSKGPYGGMLPHGDTKVAELFDRLRVAATNFEERVKIYRELERHVLVEQVYEVPLWGLLSVIPYRTYVKGIPVPAESMYNNNDWAVVWLDK